jgi:hypothetical protein
MFSRQPIVKQPLANEKAGKRFSRASPHFNQIFKAVANHATDETIHLAALASTSLSRARCKKRGLNSH